MKSSRIRHVGDAPDRALPQVAGGGFERFGVNIAE
jgi:hypothetical protein